MAATATATPAAAPATATTTTPAAGATTTATIHSASLYCGNLAPDVTEAQLFDIFNQIGQVASIRVCRDATTRRSLGYAYINYHDTQDADRALNTLNYTNLRGRPLRLMWSQRDPSLRKSGVGNIFIKNLEKSIDNKALHDTFSAFGNILSCKVVTDENGVSRGYGYVHFESAEAAERAIARVDGMLLNEQRVFVGHHIPRRERESQAEKLKKNFTNIYFKNIPEDATEEELKELFSPYGEITSLAIMRDEGKSKGFGFVNMKDHEAAAKAVAELHDKEYKGKKLFVCRAQKKTERLEELSKKFEAKKLDKMNKYQGVNLYIKNLDDSIDDEKLRNHFSVYGTITSAKIARDERGNSKGFGFVCFSSAEEATRAVTACNNEMFGSKPIYVALAQRKEVRRQQLEQQRQLRAQAIIAPNQYYPQMMFNPMMAAAAAQGPRNYMPPYVVRPRFAQQGRPSFPIAPTAYAPPAGMGIPPQQRGAPRQPPTAAGGPAGPRRGPGAGPQGVRPSANGIPPAAGPGAAAAMGPRRPYGGPAAKYPPAGAPPMRYQGAAIPPAAAAAAAGGVPNYADQPLTATLLAQSPPETQKQILGTRLFPLVAQIKGDQLAGKITGMLLEMDASEVLGLLENPEALQAKVIEAENALKETEAK